MSEQQHTLGVVWEQVVRELSAGTLSPQQRAWMRVTRPIGLLDGTALLAAPSEFAKEAIERALREPITEALSRRLGRAVSLAVKVDAVTAPAPKTHSMPDPAPPMPAMPPMAPVDGHPVLNGSPATEDKDGEDGSDTDEVDEEGDALATVHEIWPTFTGQRPMSGQPFTAPAQPQSSKTRLN